MNGLKYIRVRCNLSLNDLAECIGVTRQALSAWENGKKRNTGAKERAAFRCFRDDQRYFGEISEEEKITCLKRRCSAMTIMAGRVIGMKPQDKDGEKSAYIFSAGYPDQHG